MGFTLIRVCTCVYVSVYERRCMRKIMDQSVALYEDECVHEGHLLCDKDVLDVLVYAHKVEQCL